MRSRLIAERKPLGPGLDLDVDSVGGDIVVVRPIAGAPRLRPRGLEIKNSTGAGIASQPRSLLGKSLLKRNSA